jgi:hypothetical protein
MHLAALAAGLVTLHGASAFLIPPAASLPYLQETDKSAVSSVFGADLDWHVDLPCPDCPWAGAEDVNGTQFQWTQDHETSLVRLPLFLTVPRTPLLTLPPQLLTLSASPANGLLINHIATLLPGDSHSSQKSTTLPLLATQKHIPTGATSQPYPLDFVLERLPPVTSASSPSHFLVPLKFTIVGFAGFPVRVDSLSIDLLAGPEHLSVVRVRRVPFGESPGARECAAEGQGGWSLCRVRAIVRERVRMMREGARKAMGRVKGGREGCHGRKQGGARVWHGHGAGHAGHRAQRWAKLLHSALRFFVIPALLGVIGGLLASAVGMLVGQFIVWCWLRFVRGERSGEQRRERDEKRGLLDEDAEGEEAGEQSDEEVLPKYEDGGRLPEYKDVEAQTTVEETA